MVPTSLLQGVMAPVLAIASLALVSGCATSKVSGPQSGRYVVSSVTAEFYKYGPAQSFGPDLLLKKGDRVTMVERTWGFSKVVTDNGISGYIASEDLEPAPALESSTRLAANGRRNVHAPIGTEAALPSRQSRIRNEVLGDPSDPLFNVNDVPLPMPEELPANGQRPQFRTTQPAPPDGAKPKPRFR